MAAFGEVEAGEETVVRDYSTVGGGQQSREHYGETQRSADYPGVGGGTPELNTGVLPVTTDKLLSTSPPAREGFGLKKPLIVKTNE